MIRKNKEWTKNEEEWIKRKVEKDEVIAELKQKNEDKKHLMDELKSRHEAEKKAIYQNKNEDYDKIKNELEALKEKFHGSTSEIHKLARFVNIFGKTT